MTRRLAELRRLPSRERVALLHAWVALLVVRVGLHVLSLPRLARLVSAVAPVPAPHRLPAERVMALVDVAARRPPRGASCLERSLAARWLLARRGYATDLRIGVARARDGVAAHAWLEREGRPLGGAEADDGYEVLAARERGGA